MSGPERIWICRHFGEYGPFYPTAEEAEGEHGGIALEYIRRDRDALAALPELQALIRQAVEAERERIITGLRDEADVIPCSEDAMVTEGCADLIEADFSYDEAERIAAIRKRGEMENAAETAPANSLEWTRERSGFWTAKTCVGLYSIIRTDDGYAYSIDFDELGHIGHNADVYPHYSPFSCAKAWSEADYADRLSALEVAPNTSINKRGDG